MMILTLWSTTDIMRSTNMNTAAYSKTKTTERDIIQIKTSENIKTTTKINTTTLIKNDSDTEESK